MADMFEDALASIGAAIADVREKVVEEGWFGRVVTDGQSATDSGAGEPAVAAPVAAAEESPQITCLFDQQLDTIISAPPDPDLQPHGQVVDR
jgi:hypothetical protein